MTRQWSPDHTRLANAAVTVRCALRRLTARVDAEARMVLAGCCDEITRALKARNDSTARPAADTGKGGRPLWRNEDENRSRAKFKNPRNWRFS